MRSCSRVSCLPKHSYVHSFIRPSIAPLAHTHPDNKHTMARTRSLTHSCILPFELHVLTRLAPRLLSRALAHHRMCSWLTHSCSCAPSHVLLAYSVVLLRTIARALLANSLVYCAPSHVPTTLAPRQKARHDATETSSIPSAPSSFGRRMHEAPKEPSVGEIMETIAPKSGAKVRVRQYTIEEGAE
jgi:hypothetical protein